MENFHSCLDIVLVLLAPLNVCQDERTHLISTWNPILSKPLTDEELNKMFHFFNGFE